MRPALKAGLLPVWRDRDTLQIGVDPRRATALAGIRHAGAVVGLLDGSRDLAGVIEAAAGLYVTGNRSSPATALAVATASARYAAPWAAATDASSAASGGAVSSGATSR